ncbi:hypothetical protein [Fonticella tunisiensis]|uniref:Uncharacterized protein n=1 Tax=Fonticella tunisiensis TaxID=1096341 RepID=A0A4R7KEA5_9CLOT|nr:hypothetical protein [Fonticella tunisiensis]TDT51891.1 hypothetical protein EDD71_11727 [Fonticella tunisiensis]
MENREKRRRILQDDIRDEMKRNLAFGPDNVSLKRSDGENTAKSRVLEDITEEES